MTLKVKMVSCITMFMLALAMLIVGIYAASVQTIRLNGTVNFEITDKSLYVQDVRLQESMDTTPQSLKASGKFMAGYINLDFNMNLGEFTNNYGSFALYFDIINTGSSVYTVKASTTQSGVTVNAIIDNENNEIPAGTVTPEQIKPETEKTASVKLTVTAATGTIVELNKITVTMNEFSPTTISAISSAPELGQAQGDSAFVGEEVTLTANFVENSADADFLGWRANTVDGELVSTLPEYTFTLQEDSPTTYYAIFEEKNAGIEYDTSAETGEASIKNKGVSALTNGYVQIPSMIIRTNVEYRVTSIADASSSSNSAFYNVKSTLMSVTLPDTLTSIGERAFYYCDSLTSVTFGENSQLTSIGDSAFYGCSKLESIEIPSSVTSIGSYAFRECSGLTSVHITDIAKWCEIQFSDYYTLYYARNICLNGEVLTDLVIPEGVTSIGNYAFYYCDSLTSITIPSSVTSIGNYAFYNCGSLTRSTFGENSKLASIGNYTFYNCDSLTSIEIPSSVISIGSFAFCGIGLTGELVIPLGVTSIGSSAFSGCDNLTSIEIPSSVTSIGSGAFNGCGALVEVYNYSTSIPEVVVGNSSPSTNGCLGQYAKVVYNPSDLTGEKPEKRIIVENNVQYYVYGDEVIALAPSVARSSLTEVTLRSNTTSINQSTFSDCSGLQIIDLSQCAELLSIGDYAFSSCSSLTSITIPSSVTSIGSSAFYGCGGLESVTIGEGVTSIGDRAFYNCRNLIEINFNAKSMDDLESKNYVFYNAGQDGKGIMVNIGAEVTKIPAYLFNPYSNRSYSPKITSVIFAEGSQCEIIGSYAFYGCGGLESVTIGEGVTSIGNYAFYSCDSLTSVTFGENSQLTSIGGRAFYGCSKLESIEIPSSVTSIGNYAFYGCSSLTSVTFNTTYEWEVSTSISFSTIKATITPEQVQTNALTYLTSDYYNCYWRVKQ